MLISMRWMVILVMMGLITTCNSGAVQLDSDNIDSVIQNFDFVFVNFYADWCRFSNLLAPVWDEGADLINKGHVLNGLGGVMNAVQAFYWPVLIMVYFVAPEWTMFTMVVLFCSHVMLPPVVARIYAVSSAMLMAENRRAAAA